MQPRFVVVPVRIRVKHPMRLYENDVLLLGHDPQNKVGIEAPFLKKADAPSSFQIPQEKYFHPGQQFVLFACPKILQALNELRFTVVQSQGRRPYLIPMRSKQWMIKMSVKINARYFLYFILAKLIEVIDEFLNLAYQLALGLLDIDQVPSRVIVILGSVRMVEAEIRVTLAERLVNQVARFPTLPSAPIEGVHIFSQNIGHCFLQASRVPKRLWLKRLV